jgi:hypothetical protein
MNFPVLRKIISIGIVIAAFIPFFAFAQTDASVAAATFSTQVNQDDIDVVMTPEFPGAFTKISIRLNSNTINLNNYMIDWTVNGSVVQTGMGLRDYSFTSGGYGSTTKIGALVHVGPLLVKKDITISPQDATLLWEAIDSSVPPFYRGKKLPGREALITISGIPNFRSNNSVKINDAVYLWSRNGNRILNAGGYAKDAITIKQNRLRTSEQITTDISDMFGAKTQKTVTIPSVNPEFHWYTRNEFGYRPLRSIDQGLRILKGDVTLVNEPYFFSVNKGPNDLAMVWKTGSDTISLDPDSSKQELLVHNPGQTGQVLFQISATNPKTFLQSAARSVSLYFQN